jgi:transposase
VLLESLNQDLARLDERVNELVKQIETLATNNPAAKCLQQIPGIGPLIATALVCAIGEGRQFKRGRDMAAWLGFTPGQYNRRQRKIAEDQQTWRYLFAHLLIHGARSVLAVAIRKEDPRSNWLQSLC